MPDMGRKPAVDDQEAFQQGYREALSAFEVTLVLGSAFAALVKASRQQNPGLGWYGQDPSASVSELCLPLGCLFSQLPKL